jgi:exopolysaccharide production protein ExoQ
MMRSANARSPSAASWGCGCLVALLALSYLRDAPDVIFGNAELLDGTNDLAVMTPASSGDNLRQLCFGLIFVVTAWVMFKSRGLRAIWSAPRSLLLPLGWCWLSVCWAVDPGIALRRVIFTTLLILMTSWISQLVAYRTIVRSMVAVFIVLIVADWAAVMIFPLSVHPPNSLDPSLVGDWRGLQSHKNEAGAMCAIALITFLFETVRLRSYVTGPLMTVVAAAFLYLTHSKTSGGMVILAIAVGWIAQIGYRRPVVRNLFICGSATIVLVCFGLWSDTVFNALASVLDDPGALTGRTQIWQVLSQYISDHPLLGAGYGSFFAIGSASPIFQYGSGWITTVDHAHNGYLNVLVEIGSIGLVLVVYNVVLRPYYFLLFRPIMPPDARVLITSILTFTYFHDLLETSIFNRDASTWVVMLLIYCTLDRLKISESAQVSSAYSPRFDTAPEPRPAA